MKTLQHFNVDIVFSWFLVTALGIGALSQNEDETDGEIFLKKISDGQKMPKNNGYLMFTAPYKLCKSGCKNANNNFIIKFPLYLGRRAKENFMSVYPRDYRSMIVSHPAAPFRTTTHRPTTTMCPTYSRIVTVTRNITYSCSTTTPTTTLPTTTTPSTTTTKSTTKSTTQSKTESSTETTTELTSTTELTTHAESDADPYTNSTADPDSNTNSTVDPNASSVANSTADLTKTEATKPEATIEMTTQPTESSKSSITTTKRKLTVFHTLTTHVRPSSRKCPYLNNLCIRKKKKITPTTKDTSEDIIRRTDMNHNNLDNLEHPDSFDEDVAVRLRNFFQDDNLKKLYRVKTRTSADRPLYEPFIMPLATTVLSSLITTPAYYSLRNNKNQVSDYGVHDGHFPVSLAKPRIKNRDNNLLAFYKSSKRIATVPEYINLIDYIMYNGPSDLHYPN